ncbi:Protein phosphatase inhibitor activity protein [Halocaridina rubra]|uniref:Protein phosphatase inhibitor activity protein n=1 Tax=Halocaridina rubra TaxID=373956 RepID=A0AAN9A0V3_HALRR
MKMAIRWTNRRAGYKCTGIAMADNLHKQPRKGILKNSSSFEGNGRQREKETKWDEMNILATLHPKDKDYGHMKIEEPKTPFTHYTEGDSGDEHDGLDVDLLSKKIEIGGSELPKALIELESEEEEEEDEDLSPEEKEKKKLFEMKRKKHYNEFYAVKLARKLMENDEEEDDEDEDDNLCEKKEGAMEETAIDERSDIASPSEEMATEEQQQASGD